MLINGCVKRFCANVRKMNQPTDREKNRSFSAEKRDKTKRPKMVVWFPSEKLSEINRTKLHLHDIVASIIGENGSTSTKTECRYFRQKNRAFYCF